jgi:hypothetical protein
VIKRRKTGRFRSTIKKLRVTGHGKPKIGAKEALNIMYNGRNAGSRIVFREDSLDGTSLFLSPHRGSSRRRKEVTPERD